MLLYKVKDFKELSRKAANIISAQVILKPTSVLGLATGSTPVGTYKQLIEWYEKGDIDFSQATTINLDEYKGLGADDVQSYRCPSYRDVPFATRSVPFGTMLEERRCTL